MASNIPITLVRYDSATARGKLKMFLFDELRYAGTRPPRGIEPLLVSEFLAQNLKPDSPPSTYERVLELLRFYERHDALKTIRLALNGHETKPEDAMRSAYALQAIAELGTAQEAGQAADYFDRVLVRKTELTPRLYPVLFDVLVSTAPAGSIDPLAARLRQEVAKLAPLQRTSEKAMFEYDEMASVQNNDLPRYTSWIEFKKQLLGAPENVRRAEMVRVYLGLSLRGGGSIPVWCARMLRKEAMEGDPAPVLEEFSKNIDSIDENRHSKTEAASIFMAGAEAILYLHGRLTPQQREKYATTEGAAGQNFLWDDLPIQP